MAELLETEDHDLHFVHFDALDATGHGTGFSPENEVYTGTLGRIDTRIGSLLTAIADRAGRDEERWLVVVTTDHGGQGLSHGGDTVPHRAIPLVVWGDGLGGGELTGAGEVPGELDVGFVSHMDVHATVLEHLGLASDAAVAGRPRGL